MRVRYSRCCVERNSNFDTRPSNYCQHLPRTNRSFFVIFYIRTDRIRSTRVFRDKSADDGRQNSSAKTVREMEFNPNCQSIYVWCRQESRKMHVREQVSRSPLECKTRGQRLRANVGRTRFLPRLASNDLAVQRVGFTTRHSLSGQGKTRVEN